MINPDRWEIGCGGCEVPFTLNGTRWLYVWNPYRSEHGYLNMSTDIVTPDHEWHALNGR